MASAVLVTDERTVTAVTGIVVAHPVGARAPRSESREEPRRERATPYPESHVRYAEDAAALLQAVQRRGEGLAVHLDTEPQLFARMQVALAGCLVSLEELKARFGRS